MVKTDVSSFIPRHDTTGNAGSQSLPKRGMSSSLVALHQFKDDVVWPNRLSLQMLLHGHYSSKLHAGFETLEAIFVEEVQPMPLARQPWALCQRLHPRRRVPSGTPLLQFLFDVQELEFPRVAEEILGDWNGPDRRSFRTPRSSCCGREIDAGDFDDGLPRGFLVGAIVEVWVALRLNWACELPLSRGEELP